MPEKVATLTAWAIGPYRQAFQSDNLTVAVVVPTRARREQLSEWTRQELEAIGQPGLADIFPFTERSPVKASPFVYFFAELWYPAGAAQAVSMLDIPDELEVTPIPDQPPVSAYNFNLSQPIEREIE